MGYSLLTESSSNFIGCFRRSFWVLIFFGAAPHTHPGRPPRPCVLFPNLHCAFSPTAPSAWTLAPGLLGSHTLYNLPTLQGRVQGSFSSPFSNAVWLCPSPWSLYSQPLLSNVGFCLSLPLPSPTGLQPPCRGGLLRSRRVQPLAQCLVQRKCPVKLC